MPLKRDYQWGYAPEYVLSAKYRVHRSYAEYLKTQGVKLEDMDILLGAIDAEHAKKYDASYIGKLAKERGLL